MLYPRCVTYCAADAHALEKESMFGSVSRSDGRVSKSVLISAVLMVDSEDFDHQLGFGAFARSEESFRSAGHNIIRFE